MILTPVASTGGGQRVRRKFVESPNGSRTVFTTPERFLDGPDGFEELVYFNGTLHERGAGCDYLISEGGGPGSGFNTVTYSFPPKVGDVMTIRYFIDP